MRILRLVLDAGMLQTHCFKKFENHIYEFQKYYEKIQILT
jgi:hypothetical protein